MAETTGKPAVLVTGGAGYIGAQTVRALRAAGYPVVVLDDLSTGRADSVPGDVDLVVGDVGDDGLVAELLARHRIEGILHFAGSIIVPESVAHPLAYYANNTGNSRALIAAAVAAGCRAFVFSSTAAVYGDPEAVPVAEDAPTRPINPYGRAKLMTEWMLEDASYAHGLAFAALRYFNVAGADPQGACGQANPKATNLVKVACQAALGVRSALEIFGTDYPTRDGTGVRDYIHVVDLAEAHVRALDHLLAGGANLVANCGYGWGISVREIVAALEAITGEAVPVREGARRPGDPPEVTADSRHLQRVLGWQPRYNDVQQIVGDALAWERRLQAGG